MQSASKGSASRPRLVIVGLAVSIAMAGLVFSLQPTHASLPVIDPDIDPGLCRLELGVAGAVNDDSFVLGFSGGNVSQAGDLRIAQTVDAPAGSIVQAGDVEHNHTAQCSSYQVAWYDLNANGRYDPGDVVLLGNDANPATLVQASDDTEWWIRLTPSMGHAPGTAVQAGDSDLVGFGAGSSLEGAEFAYADLNNNARFDEGDNAYITSRVVTTGDSVPLYSVRLHPPGVFGTQVKVGDGDASLVLTDPEPDMAICRVDFGVAGNVSDDGFYLSHDGDDDLVEPSDVRLVPVFGKAAGSLVNDGDTLELGRSADCQRYSVAYYDVNNSGRFDIGDAMLFGYDANNATLVQPSNNTEWWIRLTPSGGRAAGTILLNGDPDLVAFGQGLRVEGAEAAFVDLDNSGTFTPGDRLYMTSQAIQTGSAVPFASVRLVHPDGFGTFEGAFGTTTTTFSTPPPTSTTPTTRPPLPPPVLSLDRPVEGETVRHVVTIAGTVDFPAGHAVRVDVKIIGPSFVHLVDFVASPGAWSVAWDTRNGDDGAYQITVGACYADGSGVCSFPASAGVRVVNVQTQVDRGIVGCAAHAGPVVVEDICNGITAFQHPANEHLASATFALEWTGLTPLDIHDLRLVVHIGDRTFVAEGSSPLALTAGGLDLATPGLATMEVSVGKAGLGPDVALDEEFVLTSVWSYK